MQRRGERGLTVIEALIMLAATALAAGMLLPVLGQNVRRDFGQAERGLSDAARQRGEAAFRAIVRGSVRVRDADGAEVALVGDAASMTLWTYLEQSSLCTQPGLSAVSLQIEPNQRGGVLRCRSGARDVILAQWQDGRAAFDYGGAAMNWRPNFATVRALGADSADVATPSLVRFQAPDSGGRLQAWIENVPPSQAAIARVADETDTDIGGGDLDR